MNRRLRLGMLLVALTWTGATSLARPLPFQLMGVTIDDVSDLPAIVDSLGSLPRKPTTRIVFHGFSDASRYKVPAAEIAKKGYVMGELLDSYWMWRYDLASYQARTNDYTAQLWDSVDIWEVGNEINGEWTGDPAAVVAKVTAAKNTVEYWGGRTAITLYYNGGAGSSPHCWTDPDHEMFRWLELHATPEFKRGIDYVFVSFYEDDCYDIQPDWTEVFARLGRVFPNARLGFGEVGTYDPAKKKAYLDRYYGEFWIRHQRFVGGFFWWMYREDMVPKSKPLWGELAAILRRWWP